VSQKTLEERLDELSKSMRDSARLVEQVSAELEARAATARQLTKDAETAEALAGLHKQQAEAVRRMMDAELAGATRRIRSDSIKIGIGSFVAGGGLTFAVTLLVHPLH
jgi:methyl-accepting chemotaxis protein